MKKFDAAEVMVLAGLVADAGLLSRLVTAGAAVGVLGGAAEQSVALGAGVVYEDRGDRDPQVATRSLKLIVCFRHVLSASSKDEYNHTTTLKSLRQQCAGGAFTKTLHAGRQAAPEVLTKCTHLSSVGRGSKATPEIACMTADCVCANIALPVRM